MSYLESFKYDIFISYSHIDNRPLTPGQRGWIDAFHDTLEVRLAQVLGVDAAVWRDPKLPGNEYFDESLPRRVRDTAIFISVVSPRYVQSEWCLKELKVFCQSAEASGGLRIGDRSRIFKVFKFPVDEPDQIPELKGLAGYEFYQMDRTGIPHELDPEMGDEPRRGFLRKVDDIAYHTRELLKEFRGTGSLVRQVERPSARAVYVAETTWDLRDQRELVRRELRQRGFRVFPEAPLTPTPELRDQVREVLRQCEASVHLIGGYYGAIPERESSSVVEIQYGLAGERIGRGGFTRIVWIPEALKPEEVRQRDFLQTLRTDPLAQKDTEILDGVGLEELKTTIHDVLERPASPKPVQAAGSSAPSEPAVYVICDPSDLDSCLALRDHLLAQEIEAILPLMEGDEADVREDHRQNLVRCDAALVYWGRAGEAWLRAQLREILKAPGYGRTGHIGVQGIYVAGPTVPAKERFRTRQALVMQEETTFSSDLRPFMDRLVSRDEPQ
jgi:hypothetical protein